METAGAGPRRRGLSLCGLVHGVRLLCWPGKVGTLVPGHGDVHARRRAVGTSSKFCCGLSGIRRWVRGMIVVSISAGIRERFRVSPTASPTTAAGESDRGACGAFLCPPPVLGGKAELGAGSGNWRLAGRCARSLHRTLGVSMVMSPKGGHCSNAGWDARRHFWVSVHAVGCRYRCQHVTGP